MQVYRMKLFVSIVSGVILGIIGSRYLFVGSWLSLIPWGIVGLLIGSFCVSKKEAIINGAVYGFVLSFVFMWAGYAGSAPVVTRIPFFSILGIFGSVCGLILALIGNALRKIKA